MLMPCANMPLDAFNMCTPCMQAYPLCINAFEAFLMWCPILEAELAAAGN